MTRDGGKHVYSTFTSKCSGREEISNWSIIPRESHARSSIWNISRWELLDYHNPENTYLLDHTSSSNTTNSNQPIPHHSHLWQPMYPDWLNASTYPHSRVSVRGMKCLLSDNSLSHRLNCWCLSKLIYVYVYRSFLSLFTTIPPDLPLP